LTLTRSASEGVPSLALFEVALFRAGVPRLSGF
jgi:hypothetical protein